MQAGCERMMRSDERHDTPERIDAWPAVKHRWAEPQVNSHNMLAKSKRRICIFLHRPCTLQLDENDGTRF